jgi:hypothetical protein
MFCVVRVLSKEGRRLVLPRTSCQPTFPWLADAISMFIRADSVIGPWLLSSERQ